MEKELYLIGNFKMNFTKSDIIPYLKKIKKLAKNTNNHVGICVPYPYLCYAKKYLNHSNVLYGAQNLHYKESGAFTGEVSAEMLNDFNCDMVIIGHSERRNYYNETDDSVNLKVLKALSSNIVPIICVGESELEREKNETFKVIDNQIKKALKDVKVEDLSSVIFAYEPIWAIGTGKTATSEQAEEVISHIKKYICKLYKLKSTDLIVVLYGGSMNEKNATELLKMPSIDGGLIGGACLNLEKFGVIFNTKIND